MTKQVTKEGHTIGYMDGTDFDCELGYFKGGVKVYPSIGALNADRKKCIDECGVIEVEVRLRRIL
jgi:hypothetical protein